MALTAPFWMKLNAVLKLLTKKVVSNFIFKKSYMWVMLIRMARRNFRASHLLSFMVNLEAFSYHYHNLNFAAISSHAL